MPATDKAPSSVRDQTFDHQKGAVGYYLDQEVRFDTKACYLGRPSNEVVQKMARLASLTADASAPTELSSEQKSELAIHPKVIKLGQRNKSFTRRIHSGIQKYRGCSRQDLAPEEEKSRGPLECYEKETAGHDDCTGPKATLPDGWYSCL